MNISQLKRLMAVALLSAVVFGNGCDPRMASEILNVVMQGMMMANQIGAMAQMSSPSQGSIVNSAPVHWVNGTLKAPEAVKTNTFYEVDSKGNTIRRDVILRSDGSVIEKVGLQKLSEVAPVKGLLQDTYADAFNSGHKLGQKKGERDFVKDATLWDGVRTLGSGINNAATWAVSQVKKNWPSKPNTVKTPVIKKTEVKTPIIKTAPAT